MKKIIFLGDSITDAEHCFSENPLGNGYVDMVDKKLNHSTGGGKKYDIVNCGHDGFTIQGVKRMLEHDCILRQPDIVSLLIGCNDVGVMMNTGKSLEEQEFEAGYESVLRELTERTRARIICMAPLIKKFGKRNLVLGGAIICIAAQVILMINPENIKLVLVASILRGLGEAPINGLTFTMLADVINYGHWKTGIRVHALIFSTFTVGQKFGGGVAGWAIGQLMQLSGFTGSVTETVEAVAMIKNLYIYGVILAWGLIAICMLAYHLDKEYDQVLAELK